MYAPIDISMLLTTVLVWYMVAVGVVAVIAVVLGMLVDIRDGRRDDGG